MIKRDDVIGLDQARKTARTQLMGGVAKTRETMQPAKIVNRWKLRQIKRLELKAAKLVAVTMVNKGLLTGLAAGVVLIAARRPIIAAVKKINKKIGES